MYGGHQTTAPGRLGGSHVLLPRCGCAGFKGLDAARSEKRLSALRAVSWSVVTATILQRFRIGRRPGHEQPSPSRNLTSYPGPAAVTLVRISEHHSRRNATDRGGHKLMGAGHHTGRMEEGQEPPDHVPVRHAGHITLPDIPALIEAGTIPNNLVEAAIGAVKAPRPSTASSSSSRPTSSTASSRSR